MGVGRIYLLHVKESHIEYITDYRLQYKCIYFHNSPFFLFSLKNQGLIYKKKDFVFFCFFLLFFRTKLAGLASLCCCSFCIFYFSWSFSFVFLFFWIFLRTRCLFTKVCQLLTIAGPDQKPTGGQNLKKFLVLIPRSGR